MKTRGEFGFIDFIKEHFPVPDNFEGIGDDCAVLPPQQEEMLFSTDLLMEGVHAYLKGLGYHGVLLAPAEEGLF